MVAGKVGKLNRYLGPENFELTGLVPTNTSRAILTSGIPFDENLWFWHNPWPSMVDCLGIVDCVMDDQTGIAVETPELSRYSIEREIARGGMGIVWQVNDREFDRKLALKTLLPTRSADTQTVARFEREATINGSLQHPAIPPVIDRGTLDDGSPFFSMKYVEGETLASLLEQRTSPAEDLARLLGIFQQVCQAVGYAHSRRILHRDLKPANIMVGAFGEVQVMDWGLAKQLEPLASLAKVEQLTATLTVEEMLQNTGTENFSGTETQAVSSQIGDSHLRTNAGEILGTLAYMPPEQARGETHTLTPGADVFALGGILCEILTGHPPHEGGTLKEIYFRVYQGDLEQAFGHLDACSADPQLIELCKQCLAKEAHDRPEDGLVVAETLRKYEESLEHRLEQEKLDRVAAEAKSIEEKKRRKILGVVMTLACLLLVMVGSSAWYLQSQHTAEQNRQIAILTEAVSRAETIRDQIFAAPPQTAEQWRAAETQWSAALETLKNVPDSARSAAKSTDWEERFTDLLANVTNHRDSAKKDRVLFERMNVAFEKRADIRDSDFSLAQSNIVVFGHSGAEDYKSAFKDFGVDVLNDPIESVVKTLSESALRMRIGEALTDWLVLWHRRPEAQRILDIVQKVDPDPDRCRFRTALLEQDGQQMLKLAESINVETCSPATILPLVDGLDHVGEYEAAIRLLENALTHHPENFWYQDVFGAMVVTAHPERLEEAIAAFRVALALRPDAHFVYVNLTNSLGMAGRFEQAERVCRKSLSFNPHDIRFQLALLQLYSLQNRQEEAKQVLADCLKDHPESARVQLQTLYLKSDEDAETHAKRSLKVTEKILADNPNHIEALHARALAHVSLEQWAEAKEIGEGFLKNNPALSSGYEILSLVAYLEGDNAQAERIAKQGLAKTVSRVGLHDFLFRILDEQKHSRRALGHLQIAAATYPGSLGYQLWLGSIYEARELWTLAEHHYWQQLIKHPHNTELRSRLKAVLKETGNLEQVRILLADTIANLSGEQQWAWTQVWADVRESIRLKTAKRESTSKN